MKVYSGIPQCGEHPLSIEFSSFINNSNVDTTSEGLQCIAIAIPIIINTIQKCPPTIYNNNPKS